MEIRGPGADGERLAALGALLADEAPDPAWLSALEARMAEAGALIVMARARTLAALQAEIDDRGERPFPQARLGLTGEWEAMAADAHKKMILDTRATDVFLTASIDGAPANWLTPSLLAAGIDLDVLRTTLPGKVVAAQENKKRWKDIYTAGHGVGNIRDVPAAAELCRRLVRQYREAKQQFTGGGARGIAA